MARASRKKSQAVTIDAVARHAGVSAMTVSNVLNNTKSVRETTRELVLRAVQDLNYTPNLAAKSLASAEVTRVGLLVGSDEYSFASSVLGGAVEATTNLGAQLLIRRVGFSDHTAVARAVDSLVAGGIHALVLPGLFAGMLREQLAGAGLSLPVVSPSPGLSIDGVHCVRICDETAAWEMTRHLISLGHRRIGFVRAEKVHLVHWSRFAGFMAAHEEAGLPVDSSLVVTSPLSFHHGLNAARELLDRPDRPTAIFASNDDTAGAVVALAHKLGLRVPEDISVAGFDDSPLAVRMLPMLTTVRQPVADIARRATELAIQLARSSDDGRETSAEIVPHKIVERETTAPPGTSARSE